MLHQAAVALRAVEKYRRLEDGDRDSAEAPNGAINVRVDRRTVRIDLKEIDYAESLGDYVVIHTMSR